MFFVADHFKELRNLDPDQLKLIAKIANDTINTHGVVVYGTRYADGTLESFSTDKERDDMHVGIVVGIREMGILPTKDKEVHHDSFDDKDKSKSSERLLSELQREVRQLRKIQNQIDIPHPPDGHPV